VHAAFGETFRVLDLSAWGKEPFPEDRFVRLLGIRAYWGSDINCISRNAQQLFDHDFKPKCNEAASESRAGALITRHLQDMISQTKALNLPS
jgi:hypothetical protein